MYVNLSGNWNHQNVTGPGTAHIKMYMTRPKTSSTRMWPWHSTLKTAPTFRDKCDETWFSGKSSASEGWNVIPKEWSFWCSHTMANSICKQKLNMFEIHYSNIEWEALNRLFGLEKFHYYCFTPVGSVILDHKPLVTIFKKDVRILHKPGPQLFIIE